MENFTYKIISLESQIIRCSSKKTVLYRTDYRITAVMLTLNIFFGNFENYVKNVFKTQKWRKLN